MLGPNTYVVPTKAATFRYSVPCEILVVVLNTWSLNKSFVKAAKVLSRA